MMKGIDVMEQNRYLQTALDCQVSYGNDPMVSYGQAGHINSMLNSYRAQLPESTIALLKKHATDLNKLGATTVNCNMSSMIMKSLF